MGRLPDGGIVICDRAAGGRASPRRTCVFGVGRMVVIVGLGNPGARYRRTRHNVGFDVVEILAERNKIALTRSRGKALVGEGMIGGVRVALCQPQTYMNLSGESVVQLVNWYKPEPGGLIVTYDDVDLPLGKVRVRAQGSAGTHNGMRSIIGLCGRDDFPRVRVGIGRPPEGWDLADFVLTRYETADEREIAFAGYMKAAQAIEVLVKEGVTKAAAFASL